MHVLIIKRQQENVNGRVAQKKQLLLQRGAEVSLQEFKREESKKRKLQRDNKSKMQDVAWKRMDTAGNVTFANSAGDIPWKKTKKREPKEKKSAPFETTLDVEEAVDKKQAAVQRVEAKEKKTGTVYTTENVEEAEDKKPAAVQRVEDVEEEEDKKPAAEDRAMRPQKTKLQNTKLQGHIVSKQEVNLIAKKAGDNNEVWDETWSLQWGGTGTSAQEAITIPSQSPIADRERMTPLVTRANQMFSSLMIK